MASPDSPATAVTGPARDLGELLAAHRRITVFTGAGVSTESGIPDFRSPGGVWTRYDPREFTFSRFVESADVRRRAWAMRREMLALAPRPNPAHHAIAALEAAGRSPGVVTQNVDGLHQDAGSREVVELHGTGREVMCIGTAPQGGVPKGCGWREDTAWVFAAVEAGDGDPRCPDCEGLVKSATVSFGQALPLGVLERAAELVEAADCMLVVGSSLQVRPAAGVPAEAAERGATLVIVNAEPTPLDDLATLVLRDRAGELLPPAVAHTLSGGGA